MLGLGPLVWGCLHFKELNGSYCRRFSINKAMNNPAMQSARAGRRPRNLCVPHVGLFMRGAQRGGLKSVHGRGGDQVYRGASETYLIFRDDGIDQVGLSVDRALAELFLWLPGEDWLNRDILSSEGSAWKRYVFFCSRAAEVLRSVRSGVRAARRSGLFAASSSAARMRWRVLNLCSSA